MIKKKILVVEDNPHMVEVLRQRLENAGYLMLSASDGQSGLDLARQEKPDLIILDVMLPKMNGYKVSRFLKFDAKYRDIPIFMLTSRVKDVDEQTGRHTGADEFIRKPYEPKKLMELIRSYLKEEPKTATQELSLAKEDDDIL